MMAMPLFKVFISHDQNDMKNVELLSNVLMWNNVEPLVAEPTPKPGLLIWKEKISEMIKSCDFFVVFYSQSSRTNPNVNQEIGAAGILGKRIFALTQNWFSERDLTGFLEGVEVVKDYDSYNPHESINQLYQLLYQTYQGELPKQFYGISQRYGKVLIKYDEISDKMCYYKMNSQTAKWEQVGEYPERY
jgi:hypothetical protein